MYKTIAFLSVVVVSLAGAAAQGAEVPTFPRSWHGAWSPDGKQIAFTTDRRGTFDIFVMNADGSNQRPLLAGPTEDWWPVWSPDGARIAFSSDRDGIPQIYTLDLRTDAVTRLTYTVAKDDDDGDFTPAWSSNGQIAFDRTLDSRSAIFAMNADGSNVHRVSPDKAEDYWPRWSPDGTKLVFVDWRDDAFVSVMNADGTGRVRLTSSGDDAAPSWSPDGAHIVFATWREDDEDEYNDDLWMMNADGSDQHKLFGTGDDEWGPSFSPSGRSIAFGSNVTGESQIYTIAAGGGNATRLTGLPRVMSSSGRRCTIIGTPGHDVLRGTSRDDVVCGLGGNDVIDARGGDDLVDGGAGHDVLTGGPGDDTILGGLGPDTIYSVDGFRDSVDGGAGNDRGRVDPGDWVSFVEHLF